MPSLLPLPLPLLHPHSLLLLLPLLLQGFLYMFDSPLLLLLLLNPPSPTPPLPPLLQGFLYVFDCNGIALPGFPLQMGDIQVGSCCGHAVVMLHWVL